MSTVLVITSAAFSPNPVSAGATTRLSVGVMEITQTPYTQVITAGELTAGEF